MRLIQKGDKVKAHLNAAVNGIVVEVFEEKTKVWTLEGTQSLERFCIVKGPDDKLFKIKSSDLYVDYD
jgi:hypothetical protein